MTESTLSSSCLAENDMPAGQIAEAARPWAIILAAGSGTRLAGALGQRPKQFLDYLGLPLYRHSAQMLASCPRVQGIIFVFPPQDLMAEEAFLRQLEASRPLGLVWRCVAGGARRQDSVRQGLLALPPQCRHVLVHDAARPFATPALVQRLCEALDKGAAGVIPGIAVSDTIKQVQDNCVLHTLPRHALRAVQTPQAFDLVVLHKAHATAHAQSWEVTDDAALLERCHIPVLVVAGEEGNKKITTFQDLTMLHASPSPLPCTGFGYDVHRFGSGRPLKLGGVLMPGDMEVLAHSDGDVLLHALMDAILGCAAAGDIGQHFPDTAAAFANADSAVLLDEVLAVARRRGLQLVHADLTVIAQKPKVGPQRQAIQKNVARLLALPLDRVNVKATTEEGLGFTGSCEGIKAVAVVTALRATTSANSDPVS